MIARTPLWALLLAAAGVSLAWGADARRGQELFASDNCVLCHSINDKGGADGPDLGKRHGRDFTPSNLASLMWNHAPKMWEDMAERNIRRPSLSRRDAEDLFAYLYSVRYFDKPGDSGRGRQVFETKRCAECHGLAEAKPDSQAKAVAEWTSSDDPVLLFAEMWAHASAMQASCDRRRITWPGLTGQNLVDLVAYLRRVPHARLAHSELMVLDSHIGALLFAEKGCAACHTEARSLKSPHGFRTLADVAAAMWNQAAKMATAKPTEPGEMRQIVACVWERQFSDSGGNAEQGHQVFETKGCAACHGGVSPSIPKLPDGRQWSAFSMIEALWQHGPQMLRRMTAQSGKWPTLSDREMADVVAYLNSHP